MLNFSPKQRMAFILISFFSLMHFSSFGQSNIVCTNPTAEAVMKGHYNPNTYLSSLIIIPDSITQVLNKNVNPDSLYNDLVNLASFQTRNSGSDTVSSIRGIGSARRWVYQKF